MKSLPHSTTKTKQKYQPGELVVGDYKWVHKSQLDRKGCIFFILMVVGTAYNALYAVSGKDESLSASLSPLCDTFQAEAAEVAIYRNKPTWKLSSCRFILKFMHTSLLHEKETVSCGESS